MDIKILDVRAVSSVKIIESCLNNCFATCYTYELFNIYLLSGEF